MRTERVVDRAVTVRVQLAHDVADDARAFHVRPVGPQAHRGHLEQDAPVHRLQAVARVGQRPAVDDRVGVLEDSCRASPRRRRCRRSLRSVGRQTLPGGRRVCGRGCGSSGHVRHSRGCTCPVDCVGAPAAQGVALGHGRRQVRCRRARARRRGQEDHDKKIAAKKTAPKAPPRQRRAASRSLASARGRTNTLPIAPRWSRCDRCQASTSC